MALKIGKLKKKKKKYSYIATLTQKIQYLTLALKELA
jgi:hypothetical protein